MKSLLTFTLAAGVAITTGTVAEAAGTAKGIQSAGGNNKFIVAAPSVLGTRASLPDRNLINLELSKLMTELEPIESDDENLGVPAKKKSGGSSWTF